MFCWAFALIYFHWNQFEDRWPCVHGSLFVTKRVFTGRRITAMLGEWHPEMPYAKQPIGPLAANPQ